MINPIDALETALRCQVCKDFLSAPVLTSCCHTFCSSCIRHALAVNSHCPSCRTDTQPSALRRCPALQDAADAFAAFSEWYKTVEEKAKQVEEERRALAERRREATTRESHAGRTNPRAGTVSTTPGRTSRKAKPVVNGTDVEGGGDGHDPAEDEGTHQHQAAAPTSRTLRAAARGRKRSFSETSLDLPPPSQDDGTDSRARPRRAAAIAASTALNVAKRTAPTAQSRSGGVNDAGRAGGGTQNPSGVSPSLRRQNRISGQGAGQREGAAHVQVSAAAGGHIEIEDSEDGHAEGEGAGEDGGDDSDVDMDYVEHERTDDEVGAGDEDEDDEDEVLAISDPKLSQNGVRRRAPAIFQNRSPGKPPTKAPIPAPPDDGLVPCPICGKRMKEALVYSHLDTCPGPGQESAADASSSLPRSQSTSSFGSSSASSSAPFSLLPSSQQQQQQQQQQRRPLDNKAGHQRQFPLRTQPTAPREAPIAQLNYSILSELALRKKMRELGVPAHGSKQALVRRHMEWVIIHNSNCDSNRPKGKRELLRQLDSWEKLQAATSSTMGAGASAAAATAAAGGSTSAGHLFSPLNTVAMFHGHAANVGSTTGSTLGGGAGNGGVASTALTSTHPASSAGPPSSSSAPASTAAAAEGAQSLVPPQSQTSSVPQPDQQYVQKCRAAVDAAREWNRKHKEQFDELIAQAKQSMAKKAKEGGGRAGAAKAAESGEVTGENGGKEKGAGEGQGRDGREEEEEENVVVVTESLGREQEPEGGKGSTGALTCAKQEQIKSQIATGSAHSAACTAAADDISNFDEYLGSDPDFDAPP